MPKYFHVTNLGNEVHRFEVNTDSDVLGHRGDVADIYTVYALGNIDKAAAHYIDGRRVGICSGVLLESAPEKDADKLYDGFTKFSQFPKETGGFRLFNDDDVRRFNVLLNWRMNDYKLELPTLPIFANIALSDPVILRALIPNLLAPTVFCVLAIMMDPRRFINPEETSDVSRFFSYLGFNYDCHDILKEMIRGEHPLVCFNDSTIPLPQRLWSLLVTTWHPPMDPKCESVFFKEYRQLIGDSDSIEDCYDAVMRTNYRVADYIRRVWTDQVNGWHTFNPYEFFTDRQTADQYNKRFPRT